MKKQIITVIGLTTLLVNQSFGQFSATPGLLTTAQSIGANVGIGTGTPNAKLEVLSTANQFRLSNTGTIFNDFNTNASGYLTVMPSNATTSRIGLNITAPAVGFHSNMGIARFSDPGSTTRGFQITPNYTTPSGDLPAGTVVLTPITTSGEGLSFASSGAGTAGVKLGAYAYNGLGWKSVWETANVSSGFPNLLLVKSGGNVGIGTASPVSKLEINANIGTTPDAFTIKDGTTVGFNVKPNGNTSMGNVVEIGFPTTDLNTNLNIKTTNGANTKAISVKNSINNEVFYIGCDGRTIINTQPTPSGFPASGLQINQNGTSGGIGLDVKLTNPNIYAINTNLTVKNDNQTVIRVINETYFTGANTRFQVKGNGATYIGAKVAFGNHSDALLSVYGKALFTSIYVNTSSAVWADYVFEKNYKLAPLAEVEEFYKKHKHLPDFKTAKEYENEGVNVIETQALLLKKVEELTIYIVELEKQVQQLQQSKK